MIKCFSELLMWFCPVDGMTELVSGMPAPQFGEESSRVRGSELKVQAVPVFRFDDVKCFPLRPSIFAYPRMRTTGIGAVGRRLRPTSPPSVSRLSGECASLDFSRPSWPRRPVTSSNLCSFNKEFCNCNLNSSNTLRLRYRAQPVNAVWGSSRCLLREPCGTHRHTVWAGCGVLVC
jgi:hypothetical protein